MAKNPLDKQLHPQLADRLKTVVPGAGSDPKKKRRYLSKRGKPSMKPTHYVILQGEVNAFGTGLRGVVVLKEARKWVTLYNPAQDVKARIGVEVWQQLTSRRARWWPAEARTERGRAQISKRDLT